MGDGSAVDRLVRLARDNVDWYEPCQSLALVYHQMGSYNQASIYISKAKDRAREDTQRMRSLIFVPILSGSNDRHSE